MDNFLGKLFNGFAVFLIFTLGSVVVYGIVVNVIEIVNGVPVCG